MTIESARFGETLARLATPSTLPPTPSPAVYLSAKAASAAARLGVFRAPLLRCDFASGPLVSVGLSSEGVPSAGLEFCWPCTGVGQIWHLHICVW